MILDCKSLRFKVVDWLLIALAVLPLVGIIVLKILFTPPTEGISISGALVYFTIPMPLQDLPITEAQINSVAVVLSILFFCLFLTHGIAVRPNTKRQLVAEWIVETCRNLVQDNMGPFFSGFAPFIAAIMAISGVSSLLSLLGLFPPTSDLNIVGGWAILVFILITYYKLKGGLWSYVKGFLEPIPILLPLNILGEIATPVSMTFRHYGNVLSGSVIAVLIGAALTGASNLLLGWLPGFLGEIPLLRIGIPAVLSLYFDIFSGCLQAFIFAMLTMLNVSNGFSEEDYQRRLQKKAEKQKKKEIKKSK